LESVYPDSVVGILTFLHARLAIALLALAFVLAVWGSYGYLRQRAISGGFRSTYLLLAALTAFQGLAGLAAMAFGERPHYLLHLVYGVFATVFLPGVYAYTSRGARDREAVLLAAACWIVLVAYGRGYMTGLVR